MNDQDIKRINELYALKKQRPLTEDEKREREALHHRYIADIRSSLRAHVESLVIERPDGTRVKVTPKDKLQ